MTEDEFLALGRAGYNRIPLHLETLADLDTPLSIYLKLANRPGSYLLESVIGGERFGRYSIVGLRRASASKSRGRRVRSSATARSSSQREADDPLDSSTVTCARSRRRPSRAGLRFAGGLAGYFGYDTVRYVEPRLGRAAKPDPTGPARHPPAALRGARRRRQPLRQAAPHRVRGSLGSPAPTQRAARRLEELRAQLRSPRTFRRTRRARDRCAALQHRREAFYDAVAKCKRYIDDGDMMQVQISQRIAQPFPYSPVNLYRVAALDQSLAVHVLFRLRRLPAGGRLARDPRAPRGRQGDAAPHRRDAQARLHAREGPGDGARAAGGSEGARRAPHADRPRAQRRRAHREDRHR